jgi:CRISPR-associated protein Csb2
MPDTKARKDQTGSTDLVLDAFIAFAPHEMPAFDGCPPDPTVDNAGNRIEIHWDADLDADQSALLARIAAHLSYLGRAESVCGAELVRAERHPDASWWRLGEPDGVESSDLLGVEAFAKPCDLGAVLEQTTVALRKDGRGRKAVRKEGRTLPEGTRMLRYSRASAPIRPIPPRTREPVAAMVFQMVGAVPVRMRNFAVAADAMHGLIRKKIDEFPNIVGPFLGHSSDPSDKRRSRDDHQHLHIAVLPQFASKSDVLDGIIAKNSDTVAAGREASMIVLWTPNPEGIPDEVIQRLSSPNLKVWAGPSNGRPDLAKQMATQRLLLLAAGSLQSAGLGLWEEPSRHWFSSTPYLPVRHRKRESFEEFILTDVARECQHRGMPAPESVEVLDAADRALPAELVQFRRRRNHEPLQRNRHAHYVRLRFEEPVSGPIFLGQLSHFGFGLFLPETD